jgi:energy-converting hydrogenase Eha subunit A
MALSNITYQKVSLKYGIFVGIAHILFFLVMRLLNLQNRVELSFLSALFLVIGIAVAISNFKKAKGGNMNYFQGLAIGATTGVISSTILALFLGLYVTMLDTAYLASLQSSSLFPVSLSVLSLFVLTIIYGTIPGFIIAFVAMQWFKRADHSVPERI